MIGNQQMRFTPFFFFPQKGFVSFNKKGTIEQML